MSRLNRAVIFRVVTGEIAGVDARPQSTHGQSTTASAQNKQQEVTLTGCLRQATDDARLFALVPSPDENKDRRYERHGQSRPLFDLRPEWLVDFESRPVIVANDVTIAKN